MTRTRTLRPLAALAASILALGACGDDPGPRTVEELPFTVERLEAAEAAIREVSWPELTAPLLFGCAVEFSARPAGTATVAGDRAPVPGRIAGTALVGPDVRGRTWVRDRDCRWTLDTLPDGSPRPGAPAAGTRFVVQAVVDRVPTATRLGHVDVVDVDTVTGARRHLVNLVPASGEGGIMIVAREEGAFGGAFFRQVAIGMYERDGRRLTATDSSEVRDGSTAVLQTMAAPFAGVSGFMTIDADGEARQVTTERVLRVDGREMRVLDVSTLPLDGPATRRMTIRVGGATYAMREGTGLDLLTGWTRPDGRTPLPFAELAVLERAFQLMDGFLGPGHINLAVEIWLLYDVPPQ